MKYVFLNHKFIKAENAHISIHDRGFKFGDGVFETMRIKDYLVQDLELHLLRLQSGLEAIKIKLDLTKIEMIFYSQIILNLYRFLPNLAYFLDLLNK